MANDIVISSRPDSILARQRVQPLWSPLMVGGGRPVREVRSQTWFPVGYPGRTIRGTEEEADVVPQQTDWLGLITVAFIGWALWPGPPRRQMRLF